MTVIYYKEQKDNSADDSVSGKHEESLAKCIIHERIDDFIFCEKLVKSR